MLLVPQLCYRVIQAAFGPAVASHHISVKSERAIAGYLGPFLLKFWPADNDNAVQRSSIVRKCIEHSEGAG